MMKVLAHYIDLLIAMMVHGIGMVQQIKGIIRYEVIKFQSI